MGSSGTGLSGKSGADQCPHESTRRYRMSSSTTASRSDAVPLQPHDATYLRVSPTSAPGLGPHLPHLPAPGPGSPLPYLRRDWAHPTARSCAPARSRAVAALRCCDTQTRACMRLRGSAGHARTCTPAPGLRELLARTRRVGYPHQPTNMTQRWLDRSPSADVAAVSRVPAQMPAGMGSVPGADICGVSPAPEQMRQR